MSKIAILPDIHARKFWKEPCLEHKDDFEKIVFLGDYLAPYPDEGFTNKQAIDNFKEIIQFKKDNPDKVVLLLGNHDFSYFNYSLCECRTDLKNWKMLNELFAENIKLFDLAWETKIGDKRYFLSHAGVRKGWFDEWVKGKLFEWDKDELPSADFFNNALHSAYDGDKNQEMIAKLEKALGIYSNYRGWSDWDDGSIVWADIREYADKGQTLKNDYENVVFICGHTQLGDGPIITDEVMDLDCRRAFVLDTETGEVKEWEK